MLLSVLSSFAVLPFLPLTSARLLPRNPNTKITTTKAPVFKRASDIAVSENVLTLAKKSSSTSKARSAAKLQGIEIPTGNSTTLISLFEGEEFSTNITFGSQTFEVIVDTGSSDTWLAETGFDCVDIETSAPLNESDCHFGPTYTPGSEFVQIPNENFNITYGDGEFLTGVLGYDEVTLAGITVNQTVALVNYAAWNGDGTTSGLVGLAYPNITSAFAGTNPEKDNSASGKRLIYNPIFTTMYKDGLVAPLFSLAIERDVSGPAGYLALGGVPPVNFTQDFASTPILVTTIEGYPQSYDFYTINIEGAYVNGKAISGAAAPTYIVDSGTTLNYFPTRLANAINRAFRPPAVYSEEEGAYLVSCTATPPVLGIKIGGTVFYTNPLDMILLAGTDDAGNDVCISGIDDGGSDTEEDVYVLGDTFQKNVVTVFDIGAGELKFAARENYTSNDTY
ncbi:hypothetical protein ACMFMG_007720 [Clarireedia jacksonii]